MVEALGIEFAGLAADPREVLGSEQGRRWQAASGVVSAVRMVGLMRPYAREMAERTLVATDGADLILCSSLTAADYHLAQARKIPSMGVFLEPLEPTREFSSVLTGGSGRTAHGATGPPGRRARPCSGCPSWAR